MTRISAVSARARLPPVCLRSHTCSQGFLVTSRPDPLYTQHVMGASQSTDAAPDTALHILRVAPNSPASLANLEPFFDYIVGVDGLPAEVAQGVKGDPDALAGLVRSVTAWLLKHVDLT